MGKGQDNDDNGGEYPDDSSRADDDIGGYFKSFTVCHPGATLGFALSIIIKEILWTY